MTHLEILKGSHMGTERFWATIPLRKAVSQQIRGFFDADTLAVRTPDDIDLQDEQRLFDLSTRFHEHFHFAQSVMTTYGRESHWLSEQRIILLFRILKWLQQYNPDHEIPVPIKPWLAMKSTESKEANEYYVLLDFLDSDQKTMDGYPSLSLDVLARWRDKDIAPVIALIGEDDSILPVPIGGMTIAENWAYTVQEEFLFAICRGEKVPFKEFKKLYAQIQIGAEDESKESTLYRYALYKPLWQLVRDGMRMKNPEFLFRFISDKALMLPVITDWAMSPDDLLARMPGKEPKTVFPGFRFKMLLSTIRKNKNSLRKAIQEEDYQELDNTVSTILEWPTNNEITSQMLRYLPKANMQRSLRELYVRGFELRMSEPSILVDQPRSYETLLKRLPLTTFYTAEGWVGFSGQYDNSTRDDLVFLYDIMKLSRSLLYGEPLRCFYPECPSRDSCNWYDVLRGNRGGDCMLEWWTKSELDIALADLKIQNE